MSRKIIEKFVDVARTLAQQNGRVLTDLTEQGNVLVQEHKEKGYIRRLPLHMMQYDYFSFVPLLDYLLGKQQSKSKIVSPRSKYTDSSWMSKSSLCFLNIRASGKTVEEQGDLLNAAKILPALRVNGIHLAPFFLCALSNVYNIDSLATIDDDVTNGEFLRQGMSKHEQLVFFIDVAHLLNMTVGYDLEPHMSQYSRIVIDRPELFRWVRLNEAKDGLADNLPQEAMLDTNYQCAIWKDVARIRGDILGKFKLDTLEGNPFEDSLKECERKQAHKEITSFLIGSGLWTIPSHTWNGVGLPQFSHYERNKNGEYPEFTYLNMEGENHRKYAFGILTPYRFYDGLPVNKLPMSGSLPTTNNGVVEYFKEIFPSIRKTYDFDFLRADFVDHVFDSVLDSCEEIPLIPCSDRPSPKILWSVIDAARRKHGENIGALAERMGTDIERYAEIGFDLVLGDDFWREISPQLVQDVLHLNKKLETVSRKRGKAGAVLFSIDTHDSGNPLINSTPTLKEGPYSVPFRLFLARFAGAGKGIRPKYEVMGNQDGSGSLHLTNFNRASIAWGNNPRVNEIYHNIEDLFKKFSDELLNGTVGELRTYLNSVSYWYIAGTDYVLIPVVNCSKKSSFFDIPICFDRRFSNAVLMEPFEPYTKIQSNLSSLVIANLKPLHCKLIYLQL